MNRTLIVAAIATLATSAAMAQSSVNIYGRFNVTAEAQDSNGKKTKVLQNNSSRIGFKGVEDLGGGLKAGFILEHGFNADTGLPSGAFWGRQSEVNLSGGFGMLRLGRFTSEAYFATSDYIGMHNHETGTSSDSLYAYIGRDTNKVAYRTPEFVKGLTIEAAVSANENSSANARSYDVAANYQIGALHLGAGYEKFGTAKQFAATALYEAGSFVFGGMIQRDTNGWGANLGDRTNFRGSVAYMFGSNELHLNVGKSGEYSKLKGSDATQFTLGYNYNLSKRTKVYTFYTKTNDEKKVYGFGGDFSSLAFGLRHNF
jgi:predicted porin